MFRDEFPQPDEVFPQPDEVFAVDPGRTAGADFCLRRTAVAPPFEVGVEVGFDRGKTDAEQLGDLPPGVFATPYGPDDSRS